MNLLYICCHLSKRYGTVYCIALSLVVNPILYILFLVDKLVLVDGGFGQLFFVWHIVMGTEKNKWDK